MYKNNLSKARFNKHTASKFYFLVSFLFIYFFTISSSQAQTIARQVIGISGGSVQLKELRINWTAGQQFVKHVNSEQQQFNLTQGFQQANFSIENLSSEVDFGVKIAPNPVGDVMTIYSTNFQYSELRFSLMDASGKVLLADQVLLDLSANEVSMQHLAKGTYYLNFTAKDTEEKQTLKVIKVK